jgi:osmotically-inducible protein OsmY
VQGLKALVEEIEIRLPLQIKRGDDEIAAAALSRLSWNSSLPKDAVRVKVEKGFVTLTGQVDWRFQKDAAAREIRSLFGVTGVANQTTVKPRPNTKNISDDIMHALNRSWFFDENIAVSADAPQGYVSGVLT